MGFFSWLFGWSKKKNILVEADSSVEKKTDIPVQEITEYKRRKSEPLPRNKETTSYVRSILDKAQRPDPKPTPHKDLTDMKEVEKYVDRIQGRD